MRSQGTGRHGVADLRPVLVAIFVLGLGGAPAALAAADGGRAPGCPLRLSDGRLSDVRQFRGKVVYLDFWASWCTSCVLSFPYMDQLSRDQEARGLRVVAVNMDQDPAAAQRFLARHPSSFSIVLGDNAPCARAFGVKAMPSSFLIDRRGVVREQVQGFQSGEAKRLAAKVEQLLDEPAPGA